MTIKNTVYSIHQGLKDLSSPPVKLTHVYELLAAAFGFNSYASSKSIGIFINEVVLKKPDSNAILKKAIALGYQDFPSEKLSAILESENLGAISFFDLAIKLKDREYFLEYDLEQLKAADTNPWANYCLALHFANNEDETEIGGEYWYKQKHAGRQLSGIEKKWALNYEEILGNKNEYKYYLSKASSLGCDLALLDLADKFEDASFFENDYQNTNADPMKIAEIAANLDRPHDHNLWLTKAAEGGNVNAMRELIESYDRDDLTRCWTWVYLSQLLGSDITKDNYFAIHENGDSYGDEVGGPMFADGMDGIDLKSLEIQHDDLAKLAAKVIFENYKKKKFYC